MHSSVLLLLSLATLASCDSTAYIPVSITYDPDLHATHFTTVMMIGTPLQPYTLSVDFAVTDIVLFENLPARSISYSTFMNGSDSCYFGHRRLRPPIRVDMNNKASYRTCKSCQGVLGLAADSVVWMMWPEMSFTPGYIVLGDVHDIFMNSAIPGSGCRFTINRCRELDNEYLCTSIAYLEDTPYNVSISLFGKTFLPFDFFTNYMMDKNIYRDDYTLWPPIEITFPHTPIVDVATLPGFTPDEQLAFSECTSDFVLKLKGDNMVAYSTFSPKRTLLIAPHLEDATDDSKNYLINNASDHNHIIIGVQGWRAFILHYDSIREAIFIKGFTVRQRFSTVNLVIFVVLYFIFLRWKMTSPIVNMTMETAHLKVNEMWQRDRLFDIVIRSTSYPFIIAAVALPNTKEVMEDFPLLYLAVILQVVVLLPIDVTCLFMSVFIGWREREHVGKDAKQRKGITHSWMRINLVQDIAHETLLLTGMWVLLVETRVDSIADTVSTIVISWLFYNMNLYGTMIIFFLIYGGRNNKYPPHPGFVVFILMVFPITYVINTIAYVSYFLLPFVRGAVATVDPALAVIASLVAVTAIVNISVFMAFLYIQKSIVFTIREQYKDEGKELKEE